MRDNALRHGLTAKHVVIKGEVPREYDALRAGLIESYLPCTVAETILVTQIAEGYWRLMRARKVETEFWDNNMITPERTQQQPETGQITVYIPKTYEESMLMVFHRRAADLDRISRYINTLERAYYRAIKELQKEQSLRQERVAQLAMAAESVSQNAPRPSHGMEPRQSALVIPPQSPVGEDQCVNPKPLKQSQSRDSRN